MVTAASTATESPWRSRAVPADERVESLVAAMSLREKVAQLHGLWVGVDPEGPGVAPHQSEMDSGYEFTEISSHGLGQLTRAFGTGPVDPASGAAALARAQRLLVGSHRLGIPALVHEECLAGFATWQATAYPVPLSWGASFDPALVEEM